MKSSGLVRKRSLLGVFHLPCDYAKNCTHRLGLKRITVVISFLTIIGCGPSTNIVAPSPNKPDFHSAPAPAQPIVDGFTIGIGDELQITVWQNDDLNRKLRVGPSGTIFYPLVGKIQVASLGTGDLREIITNGLTNYIVSPQVNVEISTFRSQKLYVTGEVLKPGVIVIEDFANIMDALILAGGWTIHANLEKVIVVRPSSNEMRLIAVNIEDLIRSGDADQMVYMKSGDIVFVPPTRIENVARFFDHVRRIFRPIVDIERSIILGDEIYRILTGKGPRRAIIDTDSD